VLDKPDFSISRILSIHDLINQIRYNSELHDTGGISCLSRSINSGGNGRERRVS
jgi:hypothetical protein